MNHAAISELLRADFNSLLSFKERGKTLEVITPWTMANRDAVSVFVKEQGPGYVCAIELVFERLRPRKRRQLERLVRYYGLRRKDNWFYKLAGSQETIGSAIFDIACFANLVSWDFPIKPEGEA